MFGRTIETRQVNVKDIVNLELGQSYSSGVYNIVISQGESTKTLRVIKR